MVYPNSISGDKSIGVSKLVTNRSTGGSNFQSKGGSGHNWWGVGSQMVDSFSFVRGGVSIGSKNAKKWSFLTPPTGGLTGVKTPPKPPNRDGLKNRPRGCGTPQSIPNPLGLGSRRVKKCPKSGGTFCGIGRPPLWGPGGTQTD